MDVLVVEDDELMAELLETIVLGLYPDVAVRRAADFPEAQALWRKAEPDLIICDWQLPGGTGLDLVREVRQAGSDLRFLMVTARSDRQSVLAAARHQVCGFITKPFSVDMVHRRLAELIPPASSDSSPEPNAGPQLNAELERAVREGVQLSTSVDANELLALMDQEDLGVADLEKRWREQPAVQTRLIDAANSSAFQRSGEPVSTLGGALRVLGTRLSLDIVLAMALNLAGSLQTDYLKQRADHINGRSERVAKLSVLLARKAKVDEGGCFSAGMLHRIGELAVISVAQRCINKGGSVDESELNQAIEAYSARLAGSMKARWRLSVVLKQMIGAAHALPEGSVHLRLSVMRLASLVVQGKADDDQSRRLLRRLGIAAEEAGALLEHSTK